MKMDHVREKLVNMEVLFQSLENRNNGVEIRESTCHRKGRGGAKAEVLGKDKKFRFKRGFGIILK